MLRLIAAATVGCLIGVERERKGRPAGMRTHILVCVGAATISILECLLMADIAAKSLTGVSQSIGRISAQVVSGVGFLGAGTIFVTQKKIAGLTTAASLWNAACLGLAAGMGYYALALSGCAVVLITLMAMQRLVRVNTVKHVEVKFVNRMETMNFINRYFEEKGVKILDVDFHAENSDTRELYINMYTMRLPDKMTCKDIVVRLSEYESILSVRTRNV